MLLPGAQVPNGPARYFSFPYAHQAESMNHSSLSLIASMRLQRTVLTLALLSATSAANASGQASATASSPAGEVRDKFLRVLDRPRVPLAASPPRLVTDSGYTEETLRFASEANERVPVLIFRKTTRSDKRPVVIALHGTGGSKENMRALLRSLADRGFVGVVFDARFHGERATPVPGLVNPYQSAMLRAFRTGTGHPYCTTPCGTSCGWSTT